MNRRIGCSGVRCAAPGTCKGTQASLSIVLVDKMRIDSKIITIGLCPCWDAVCQLDGVDWGQHKVISSASSRPAGKALNISRALAWMGTKSIAAGLWGREDYEQMAKAMRSLKDSIKVKMTAVEGRYPPEYYRCRYGQ